MITQQTISLALNLDKRHFVIGDIHGRWDTFWKLLQSVNYDPTTDIIYSVGDMIDRGPSSYETFTFFQQPNTYAIRGNHENMAYHKEWFTTWLYNGGQSCLQSLKDNNYDHAWLNKQIEKLPFVIDVGSEGEEHAFRILHAELPPEWSELDFQNYLRKQNDHYEDYESILWSRNTISKAYTNKINNRPLDEGIIFNSDRSGRNVFVGHTSLEDVWTIGDMTYLDTGYRGNKLSMINAITKEIHSMTCV